MRRGIEGYGWKSEGSRISGITFVFPQDQDNRLIDRQEMRLGSFNHVITDWLRSSVSRAAPLRKPVGAGSV